MNRSYLIWTSLGIAILFHVVIFNLTTIIFPIEPESLKPKFFFLGSILGQNDVYDRSLQDDELDPQKYGASGPIVSEDLRALSAQGRMDADNPFVIDAIGKPELPQGTSFDEKQSLKSTFETTLDQEADEPSKAEEAKQFDLNFEHYKPLQFGSPKK